jgi:hypothetical protein
LRDELSLMTQVANSTGDRILETIEKANEHPLSKIVAHLQRDLAHNQKDIV